MDVPWGFDTKETQSFYVVPHLDLNEFPYLREPARVDASKTFGCCCWESDPLKIVNVLPQKGFIPGERVPFTLEVRETFLSSQLLDVSILDE